MKLSNTQMSQYIQALSNISDKVSGRIAYAVARNMRKISSEGQEYDMLRTKIIKKYGEKSEDGTFSVRQDSPNFDKCVSEIDEIGDIQHEVDIYMISEEDICKSDLTAKDILSIDFMIEEPTD